MRIFTMLLNPEKVISQGECEQVKVAVF